MKLEVWIEDRDAPVGLLERKDDLSLAFRYAPDVPPGRPLSMSLPVREQPYGDAACRGYFANLLFEGAELQRLRDLHGVDRGDVGGLLWHVGADCPGAVSITPEGAGPGKMPGRFPDDYQRISFEDIGTIVRSLHDQGRLPEDTRNPSPVAGVQGKIALLARPDGYWLPKPGTGAPTTHILKVSPRRDRRTTEREATLLGLAERAGVATARAIYVPFESGESAIGTLLSERFDRRESDGLIRRIHAEDFCQALGLPPDLKYERDAVSEDRRFDSRAIGEVISGLSSPGRSMQAMLDQTLFNLLVGNTDNHAKNHSILYTGAGAEIAPLYDVVPVFMELDVTHKMGFSVGGAQYVDDVTSEGLAEMMTDFGYRRPRLAVPSRRLWTMAHEIAAWSETATDTKLAEALNAQMDAVQRSLGFDLAVEALGAYERFSRDNHDFEF